MTEQQFSLLLEKLDWIGCELEKLNEQTRDANSYPRQVEIVERRR